VTESVRAELLNSVKVPESQGARELESQTARNQWGNRVKMILGVKLG